MSDIDIYDQDYYRTYMGAPDYIHNQDIQAAFRNIALFIKKTYMPRTVLDAGCACGHLTAALRDLGIEAYGIDISQYAISQCRADLRPYCAACSLSAELPGHFPSRFDLVTTIEVVEHMAENEARLAIRRLTGCSDRIIFSSSPDNHDEVTHINVHPLEYWIARFAEAQFRPGVRQLPCISPQAMVFERSDAPVDPEQACAEMLWELKKECFQLQNELQLALKSPVGWLKACVLAARSRLRKRLQK